MDHPSAWAKNPNDVVPNVFPPCTISVWVNHQLINAVSNTTRTIIRIVNRVQYHITAFYLAAGSITRTGRGRQR